MDRALYVAMTGAAQTLRAQTANNNNLANVGTNGFRAQLVEAVAAPVQGPGFNSLVNVQSGDYGWDSSSGMIQHTGRDLDVAMADNNWLAVHASDGSEAYTRGGDLHVDALGQLLTSSGQPVLSDTGPLSVPPNSNVSIASDGTISVVPLGQSPNSQAVVGRLKVVQAQPSQLVRGSDGLMRVATPGLQLPAASGAALAPGSLESSNVNIASAMVNMIQLSRNFEMQTRVMKAADDNANTASSLVRLSG